MKTRKKGASRTNLRREARRVLPDGNDQGPDLDLQSLADRLRARPKGFGVGRARIHHAKLRDADIGEVLEHVANLVFPRSEKAEQPGVAVELRIGKPGRDVGDVQLDLAGFMQRGQRQSFAHRSQQGHLGRIVVDELDGVAGREGRTVRLDGVELRRRSIGLLEFSECEADAGRIVSRQLLPVRRHIEQLRDARAR
jgi:hypothetical protein